MIHQKPAGLEKILSQVTVVLVKDTLRALRDLAHYSRKKSPSKIIGITGSNGKTTSKEFTKAVLASKYKVHSPQGSFNNHWGVPFTLLAEPDGTEISVIEMGMNHAGEIQRLAEIAQPDIAVCSMVGRAHIEHFGTVEKIAQAKEEIYKYSPAQAVRIFNRDNPWTKKMWDRAANDYKLAPVLLSFSEKDKLADLWIEIKELKMSGLTVVGTISGVRGTAEIPVFGAQNLTNILVAASCAVAVGMKPEEIWKALPLCRTSWGRNQLIHLKSGAEMLFDGYNANPDSMAALLDNMKLLKSKGKKIGVFAQMKELGEHSEKMHFDLGERVGKTGFDCVWFYGDDHAAFAAGLKSSGYSKKSIISNTYEVSLASEIASVLHLHDTVVVKGSRGMELERFVLACDPLDFSKNKNA